MKHLNWSNNAKQLDKDAMKRIFDWSVEIGENLIAVINQNLQYYCYWYFIE